MNPQENIDIDRQVQREFLFQLRSAFEWTELPEPVCAEWRACILSWFKNPPLEDLSDADAAIVGDILQIIATRKDLRSLLPNPLHTMVCLLRVVGHFPFNAALFDVNAEPEIVRQTLHSLALTNAPLHMYRCVMMASRKKSPTAMLAAIKALHGHRLTAAAVGLLGLSHPGISQEERTFMVTACNLLNFDISEVAPADVFNNLRATSEETRRILIQRAMDVWESEQALASFIRWVVKTHPDAGPSPDAMIKACALLVDSTDIAHNDVLTLVSRVVAVNARSEAGTDASTDTADLWWEMDKHDTHLYDSFENTPEVPGPVSLGPSEEPEAAIEDTTLHVGETLEDGTGINHTDRADWSNVDHEIWFQTHRDTFKEQRRDKVIMSWRRMAEKMNETFGTSFNATQLKNHNNHKS